MFKPRVGAHGGGIGQSRKLVAHQEAIDELARGSRGRRWRAVMSALVRRPNPALALYGARYGARIAAQLERARYGACRPWRSLTVEDLVDQPSVRMYELLVGGVWRPTNETLKQ